MTDREEPEAFSDVNEAVLAEWEAETTPYERIREVISHVYEPTAANIVAERARTSPKTARKHLDALAAEGFCATESGAHGGTHYRRSPESLVVEQAADILASVSVDELVERISEMRKTVHDFQTEYGVESPEELAVARTNRTLSETQADNTDERDEMDVDPEAVREWQTTRRNLAFANAALSIANAERFVDGPESTSEGSLPVQ